MTDIACWIVGLAWREVAGRLAVLLMALAFVPTSHGQDLEGHQLVEALRSGGYSIYFRHTETDWTQTDNVNKAGDWTSCNPVKMRQLSDAGRTTARRIGEAIRVLDIRVKKVLSSEYCRAVETARLMNLGGVETTRDIMNTRAADFVGGLETVIRRAQRVLSTPPPDGANTAIIGHGNLMRAATDAYASEGGSGVYKPSAESDKGFELVARLSPSDWVQLAERFANNDSGSATNGG